MLRARGTSGGYPIKAPGPEPRLCLPLPAVRVPSSDLVGTPLGRGVPVPAESGAGMRVHAGSKAVSPRTPRASFVSLPGLDHIAGFYRVDLVAPYVLAFLATVP